MLMTLSLFDIMIEKRFSYFYNISAINIVILNSNGNNSRPFIDIFVKKSIGWLGLSVYRKLTHTNRYPKSNSHYHLSQEIFSSQFLSALRSQCHLPLQLKLYKNKQLNRPSVLFLQYFNHSNYIRIKQILETD